MEQPRTTVAAGLAVLADAAPVRQSPVIATAAAVMPAARPSVFLMFIFLRSQIRTLSTRFGLSGRKESLSGRCPVVMRQESLCAGNNRAAGQNNGRENVPQRRDFCPRPASRAWTMA